MWFWFLRHLSFGGFFQQRREWVRCWWVHSFTDSALYQYDIFSWLWQDALAEFRSYEFKTSWFYYWFFFLLNKHFKFPIIPLGLLHISFCHSQNKNHNVEHKKYVESLLNEHSVKWTFASNNMIYFKNHTSFEIFDVLAEEFSWNKIFSWMLSQSRIISQKNLLVLNTHFHFLHFEIV